MALTVGDRAIHPLSADDVLRMVDAGILGEDDPVELLHGVLTAVTPKSTVHGTVIARLVRWLVANDPDGRFEVRTGHPVVVSDRYSLPEPDIAVVAGTAGAGPAPTTALLVIEVAVSSLRTDLHVKAPLYAAAGVPEYWVVDVVGRRLTVFERPAGDAYRVQRAVESGAVAPRSVTVASLDIAELFAGM